MVPGVAVLVALAPLLVGSAPPAAQVLTSALAFALALLFALSRGFTTRKVPFAGPAALAAGMTLVQLVPLPAPLVRLLSPQALDIRSSALGYAPLFCPLTLDVPATVLESAKGMACLAVLLIVGTAARRISRARPLLFTLALSGGVLAIVHIVQRVTGTHAILGVYPVQELPGAGFFGTFVNGNQASSAFALSALTAAGLAVEEVGLPRLAAVASLCLSIGVLFSTGSRAGAIALGMGALLLAVLLFSRQLGARRGTALALGLAMALVGAALLTSGGASRLLVLDSNRNGQKVRGWQDTMPLVAAYPWTGVGRGAFEAPATAFRRTGEGVRLAFPENIVLQLTSEWGIPVALLIIAMVLVAGKKLASAVVRLEPSAQAAACGVLAVVVHDLADFGLELPGVALPTMAALALVVARAQEVQDPERVASPRLGPAWVIPGLAVWAIALGAAVWALPRTMLADGRRLKAVTAAGVSASVLADQAQAAIRRHPADYYLELVVAAEGLSRRDPAAAHHLNRALLLYPGNGLIHLTAARWLATSGHRLQAAVEYRLADEHGTPVPDDELLAAVGPARAGGAVAARPERLMQLARFLMARGRVLEASEISRRAAEGGGQGPAMERLELARRSTSTGFVQEAAHELLAVASDAAAFAAAAEALGASGDAAGADDAIARGLAANPHDATLVLTGARLKLARGDLPGARATLLGARTDGGQSYTLRERADIEELRAQIADKEGDLTTAARLRAHARALPHLRE